MKIRMIILLMLVAAFSAAAQDQVLHAVRTVSGNPSVPAEIRFVDGNVSRFPVIRISKDLLRVEAGGEQSRRMPLTYVESVRFSDGCTLKFEEGLFRFDKLTGPAQLRNEAGDVLLEGVLPLTRPQAESLMGPEYYAKFRRQARLLTAGEITLFTGSAMLIPYLGSIINGTSAGNHSPVDAFRDMSSGWKWVTAGGCGLLLTGAVIALIGNSGCNRVIATYNDGLGVAYTF